MSNSPILPIRCYQVLPLDRVAGKRRQYTTFSKPLRRKPHQQIVLCYKQDCQCILQPRSTRLYINSNIVEDFKTRGRFFKSFHAIKPKNKSNFFYFSSYLPCSTNIILLLLELVKSFAVFS